MKGSRRTELMTELYDSRFGEMESYELCYNLLFLPLGRVKKGWPRRRFAVPH